MTDEHNSSEYRDCGLTLMKRSAEFKEMSQRVASSVSTPKSIGFASVFFLWMVETEKTKTFKT